MKLNNLRESPCYDHLAEKIKAHCQGRRIIYAPNTGNWGDALIHCGIVQMLEKNGLEYTLAHPKEVTAAVQSISKLKNNFRGYVLITAGCGNWCNLWDGAYEFVSAVAASFHHVIVLPSSYEKGPAATRAQNITYYRRDDGPSAKHIPDSIFCHDMAFYLDQWFPDHSSTIPFGNFFRADKEQHESAETHANNVDISSLGNEYRRIDYLFRLLAPYDLLRTDRLHVAIAGAMMRKNVELYPSKYWKIPSVFESSLGKHYPNVQLLQWPGA